MNGGPVTGTQQTGTRRTRTAGTDGAGADQARWSAVDRYVESLLPDDDVLVQVNAAAEQAGLPPIHVSASQGAFLQLLAGIQGARRALEFGTLGGYSAICIARGLVGPDPHLTTLELEPRHADVARRNIAAAGLSEVIEVRVGPAARTAAALVEDGVEPFDLVFIDADKPSNAAYLELALELTGPGAVIVIDNVIRRGAVADASSGDPQVLGSRAVIDLVATHPSLQGTAIQTVGSKGYDGFLLARVVG